MKIGHIEGTQEEVSNLFLDNGLNISDFIQKPPPQLENKWIIIPSILFLINFIVLLFIQNQSYEVKLLLFLLGFASSVWIGISVNIRFNSTLNAIYIIVSALLILAVAYGIMSLNELIDYIKQISRKIL